MSIPLSAGRPRETLGVDTCHPYYRGPGETSMVGYIWPPSIPGKHENDSSGRLRQHPWECWPHIWKLEVDSHLAAARIQPAPSPVRSESPGFLPEPLLYERLRREAKLPLCHDSDTRSSSSRTRAPPAPDCASGRSATSRSCSPPPPCCCCRSRPPG